MDKKFAAETFDYDPASGSLVWKTRPREHFTAERSWKIWNKRFPGKVAGYSNDEGYVEIRIGRRRYRAHRIIWLIVFGSEPFAIDHINGDRTDNRLSNLREVSVTENNRNARRRRDNRSGVTGVDFKKALRKWRAQIAYEGRDIHLGYFDTMDAAIEARKSAEQTYGYHRNHGSARAA